MQSDVGVKRIYYAHPMEIYYTPREHKELEIIKKHFPNAEIINPALFQDKTGAIHSNMSFFYELIDSCDILVYSDLGGFITTGVQMEIKRALERGKPVYRLDWRTRQLIRVFEIKDALSLEETQVLTDVMLRLSIDDVELAYVVREIMKERGCSLQEALKIIFDNFKVEHERFKDHNFISLLSRFYHWWQEPDNVQHYVNMGKLKTILDKRLNELGAKSLRSYILKELKLPRTRYDYYTYLFKELRDKPVEIKTLKRFCEDFRIPYIELERETVFSKVRFPLDLNNPSIFMLASHIINEGHMRTENKSIEYYNKDPVLHFHFKNRVEEIGGSFSGPFEAKKALVSYADPLTGRLLNAIGVPYGSKTINQPFVDFKRMSNDVWKYHVQTTLAEEGAFTLRVSDKRLTAKIKIMRAVDVTDILPRSFIESLDYGPTVVGEIRDKGILKLIAKYFPDLLIAEYHEFARRHRGQVNMYLWHMPYLIRVQKSKDERVTAHWSFEVARSELIDLIYDYYGVLPSTWKSIAFEKRYQFYLEHRGKKLTENEIEELHQIEKQYPWEIPKQWINQKIKELFKSNGAPAGI